MGPRWQRYSIQTLDGWLKLFANTPDLEVRYAAANPNYNYEWKKQHVPFAFGSFFSDASNFLPVSRVNHAFSFAYLAGNLVGAVLAYQSGKEWKRNP